MAKRSPETGSSPEKGKSVFKEKSAKRIAALEAEISASLIDQNKKEHLLQVASEITQELDKHSEAKDIKDFENKIHLRITSLGVEFQSVKNSNRKSEGSKGFDLEEFEKKKTREEKIKDMLAQLEAAREHLAKESAGVKGGVLFQNFGRYREIKAGISSLSSIVDDAEYEAKENELLAEILALHEIKKEEVAVDDSKEKMADVENLQPEPEEDKPVHKTKKTQKRKTDVLDDVGREQRVKKNDHAVKRWDILQEIIGKMLGEDSISEETTDAVDNNLKIMLASSDAEEYERSTSEFERNFDLIINTIPKEARLEYFSQLNGKAPSWENKSVKETAKKVVATPDTNNVVDKDTPEYRQKRYQDMEDKFILLKKIAIEMMTGKQRDATRDLVQEIDQSLETTYHTKNSREHNREMDRAESAFAELLTKIPPEVKTEFESQFAGNAPSLKKEDQAKKEVVPKKENKDQERENYIKEEMGKLAVLERVLRQSLISKRSPDKPIRDFEHTADYAIIRAVRGYLDEAAKNLVEKNDKAYSDNTNQAKELLNNFWRGKKTDGKLFRNKKQVEKISEEYRGRLRGEETEGVKQEVGWRVEGVKFLEDKISFFEKTVNKHDKDLGATFESKIKFIKDNLAEALANVKNNDIWEEKLRNITSAFKELLSTPSLSQEIKEEYHKYSNDLSLSERKNGKLFLSALFNELDIRVFGKSTPEDSIVEGSGFNKELIRELNGYKDNLEKIVAEIPKDINDQDLIAEIESVREAVQDAARAVYKFEDFELRFDLVKEKMDNLSKKVADLKSKKEGVPVVGDKNVVVADLEAGLEKEPSPEQKMYLQSYERDFGILEKMIRDSGNKDLAEDLKFRVETTRTLIEKAKKEMSKHNKMDETVMYNMQSLLEDLYKLDPKLHAEFMQKISPKASAPVAPAPEKKGFFARAKEKVAGFGKAIFNKEVGKTAGKAAYDTAATLFGVKIVTDYVYGLATAQFATGKFKLTSDVSKGQGDLAEYLKGKRESKVSQIQISAAYENLVSAIERSEKNEVLGENDKIEKRMAYLQTSVEAANISPEAKQQILQKLEFIYRKHRQDTDKAKTARTEEVKELLEAYIHSKVSGVKIAKDALNGVLTVSGLTLLRGIMYAGASYLEKYKAAAKEEVRDIAGSLKEKSGVLAKGVAVNTAIETARSLMGRGAKEGSSGVTKAMDFVKALGTVARAVGIFNITVLHGDSPKETIDNLIQAIKEKDASIISNSFVQNAKRVVENMETVGHAVSNPIETVERITGNEQPIESRIDEFKTSNTDLVEQPIPPEKTFSDLNANKPAPEVVQQPAEVPEFSVQNFAAEHGLSKESLAPLQDLVKQYPSLKEESLVRILDASKVGDGVKFHHADMVRGDVDTLIEAEGERRSVIFEELVKAKDYEAAAKYLESQNFSSRHKSYIDDYIGKGTHEDYVNFAKQYDEKPDKKMVYGLFRAMQGKGNTDLANAGLVRAATEDRAGRTISLQGGELKYFGLNEKDEPILSGQGRAVVKETVLVKITTAPTTIEHVEDIEDVKTEIDADRARFEKMREDAMNISERVRNGQPVGTYIIESGNKEAPALPISNTRPSTEIVGEETTTEKTIVGKTVKTFTASGEVVQAEKGYTKSEVKTGASNSSEIKSVPATKPTEEVSTPKKSEEIESDNKITENEKIENLKLMVKNYQVMGDYVASQRMNFVFVGNGEDILTQQIRNEPVMIGFKEYMKEYIAGNANNLDKRIVKNVETMKQTLDAFNHRDKNPDWYSAFKGDELKLYLDPNKNNLHMLANGSHIVRIADGEGGEYLLSDSDNTFVVKNDKLLKMDDGKVVQEYSYKEAVALAKGMEEK